jgi:hypothetical protein
VLAVFSAEDERYESWAALVGSDENFHVLDSGHHGFFEEPNLEVWTGLLSEFLVRSRGGRSAREEP